MCETHVAQTMTPHDFEMASYALARAADALEKQFGGDAF